jgi:hypothetical protein
LAVLWVSWEPWEVLSRGSPDLASDSSRIFLVAHGGEPAGQRDQGSRDCSHPGDMWLQPGLVAGSSRGREVE